MNRRRRVTYLLFACALGLVALAASAMPQLRGGVLEKPVVLAPISQAVQPPAPTPAPTLVQAPTPAPTQQVVEVAKVEPPTIEVVFALDTTGSMDGLLDGAKRKIWSIVDFINSGTPQPKVRIGLVAYRDRGDEYVTRFFDLTDDLDAVFKHLSSFRADGGGDTPEHVARALSDAVERTSWSTGQSVARIVYVVGDAPPHTDYDDGYDYKAIARKAARRGIHVNTIRCGDDPETKQSFIAMARAGAGQFMSIAQSGGVAVVDTPYDEKLAELNRRLTGTAVLFGRGHGAEAREKVAAARSAPAPVAADRAAYAAKKGVALFGDGDLLGTKAFASVGGLGKGSGGGSGYGAALATIKAEELPAEMAAMKPAEREAYLTKKKADREEILAEIKTLAAHRETFLRGADKRSGAMGRKDAFDDSVRSSIATDAKSAGVAF